MKMQFSASYVEDELEEVCNELEEVGRAIRKSLLWLQGDKGDRWLRLRGDKGLN